MTSLQITKNDFTKYVKVQKSGVTNMFHVKTVQSLSGLAKDKILNIMENYSTYSAKYHLH